MVVVPLADAEHVAALTRHTGSGMAWWLLRRENDDDLTDVATVLAEMVASASNPGQSVWLGRVKGSASALRYAADVTLANTGGGRWRAAGDAVVVGALSDAEVLSLIDASGTVALDLELVRTTTDRSAGMLTALRDNAAASPWGADAVVIRTAGASYAMVGRPAGSVPIRAAGLRPLSAPEAMPPVRLTPAVPRRATVTLAVGVAVGVLAVAVGLAAEHLGPSRAVARGTPAPRVHALGPQSPRMGPPPSAPAIVEVPGPVPSMARFELPAGTPVFVDHALGQPFGVDPERPEHMAYCGADAIRVTANGGSSWTTVSVAGAVAASQRTAQPIIPPAGPVCAQALVDPTSPTTVYAMFDSLWPEGARATQMAYVTGDLGRSWREVPPLAGRASTDFAGFRLTAGRVVAIFGVPQIDAPGGTAVLSETVERSLDGGRSWVTASLPCPLVGPCLRLGGAAAPGCSRFAAPNLIEFSADGGRDNRLSSGGAYLDGCSAAELVTYSSGAALRLGGFLRDTAAVSYDGGAVWQELAVPGPPGFDTGSVSYGPIILLTTGGLLTQSATGWFLLQPRARAWCAVAGNAMAALAGPVELIGDRLWSFAPDPGGDAQAPLLQATAPVSLAISALHC